MQISITWTNRYPVGSGDQSKMEWENAPDGDDFDFAAVETQAILDTPVGYYLSEISLPMITYKYDESGVKTGVVPQKAIAVEIKTPDDLKDCPEGTEVGLYFDDGSDWWGLYQGMDGNDIILKAVRAGGSTIGLPFDRLKGYLQKIGEEGEE